MLVDNPFSSGEVKPFKGPTRLLLGPGPQNAHPEVHAAMSLPQVGPSLYTTSCNCRVQVGHMDVDFLAIVEDLKKLLRYVWQTKNTFTIPVSGESVIQ